jgi:hypothetical protein
MTAQFLQQDFNRDRWGRPLIIPEGGGKPVAYTRMSGYGSVLENQFGLTKWKLRTLLKGSLSRPDLRASAESKLDDDRHLDEIVDRMMEHAGASSAANIGTAIHEVLAQLDAGIITLDQMPPAFRPYGEGWQAALAAVGYEVVPDLIELQLVNDKFQAAGSGDNFVRRISDGKLVALDKKTGKQIHTRPIAYMVQLYLYATATRYNVTTGDRTPIGDVDTSEALIAHIPASGDGTCTIYQIPLAQVERITELSRAVKAVEKTAPQVVKLQNVAVVIDTPASEVRREWVKDRLKVCLTYSAATETMTKHLWPEGVPGFKTDHQHTHRELNLILTAIEAVEREHNIPFGPTDPERAPTEHHAVQMITAAFPGATVVDQSPMVTPEVVADIKELYEAQTADVKNVITTILAEANAAGFGLSLTVRPSEQRAAAVLALIACAQFEDMSVIRAIVTHAHPIHDPASSLGKLFGTFTVQESRAVENTANAFEAGLLELRQTNTGVIVLADPNKPNNNQENQ